MQIITEAAARLNHNCHVCGNPKRKGTLVCGQCDNGTAQYGGLRTFVGGFFADWQRYVQRIVEFKPDKAGAGGRTNGMRAERAAECLAAYRGQDVMSGQETVRDCLTDIMHFAQSQGWDFAKELEQATRNYHDEK